MIGLVETQILTLIAFLTVGSVGKQSKLHDNGGGMVSKATHVACYETNTLIGFINYTAC
jgi:hypothetical protein